MSPTFVLHRVNTLADLSSVDPLWGAEIDLRSDATTGKLHLNHDPFVLGSDFSRWLAAYAQKRCKGPLILNTKEDGLETAVIELLKAAKIENYFFLDTALPTLAKWSSRGGVAPFAVRLSSIEPLEGLKAFEGRVKWVWVDCFGTEPLAEDLVLSAKKHFKVCLVSPELQGGSAKDFSRFATLAKLSDAICTKTPAAWSAHL